MTEFDLNELERLAKEAGASVRTGREVVCHIFKPEMLNHFASLIIKAAVEAEREACAKVCEGTRRALEENRVIWEKTPCLTPDEEWISDWESSACQGEEYAAAIRARKEEA